MACMRLNLSHGNSKVTRSLFKLLQSNARILRKYAEAQKLRPHKPCAKMIEIRGREIRTSEIDQEVTKGAAGIVLKMGQTVELRVDSPTCYTTDMKIHVNYRELPRLVKPNDLLYIDDGKLVFLVIDCSMEAVICEVKQGGVLGSNKSIKLPAGKHEHMPVMQLQD